MNEHTQPADSAGPGGQPAVTTSLLQSTDHRDLLDIIDNLRSQGISRYIGLPQIIVCGDQSSGKSSALEAISGMSFPTKDQLCTRFATELILRRSSTVDVKVCIIPGHDRSDVEKEELSKFTYTFANNDVGTVVDQAKEAMGLTGNDKVFSSDILRIEISGPTQPHLTMVDLPGLFEAGNRVQSEDDAKLVKSLVLSYMANPRTIILAVVSAKSDFALQQVTRHARAVDPEGVRTLGLITKPDTLDIGSESERFYLQLALNNDVKFQLGWHVLRNRSYATRNATMRARDKAEVDFFSQGVWSSLRPSQTGVAALRYRLSNVLRDQIVKQLPSVLVEIEAGIQQSKHSLKMLGEPRVTATEQRRYLLRAGMEFAGLIKASVNGVYSDDFFGSLEGPDAHAKRLRAVVQNSLLELADTMRTKGHALTISDNPFSTNSGNQGPGPHIIARNKYLDEEVKDVLRNSRGRELPGTYNPMIVAELFSKQCKPWGGIIQNTVDGILKAAEITISLIAHHLVDDSTADRILADVVHPAMRLIKSDVEEKVEEILKPHLQGHPITYNHYLTDNLQKLRNDRTRKTLESHLKKYFGISNENLQDKPLNCNNVNLKALLDGLSTATEANMDRYSCSMAADMMEAYYKVALKKVVDDIGVLAVEQCLIERLADVFSPEVVCDLNDEQVRDISSESEESSQERSRLQKKLEVLENGLLELGRVKKHRSIRDPGTKEGRAWKRQRGSK